MKSLSVKPLNYSKAKPCKFFGLWARQQKKYDWSVGKIKMILFDSYGGYF